MKPRPSELWTTLSITSLPVGWRNIYIDEDEVIEEPCPAILLQRLTGRTYPGPEGRIKFEPPVSDFIETRCVFAGFSDEGQGRGELVSIDMVGNYRGTLSPTESTKEYLAKEQTHNKDLLHIHCLVATKTKRLEGGGFDAYIVAVDKNDPCAPHGYGTTEEEARKQLSKAAMFFTKQKIIG